MIRNRLVEAFEALVDDLHLGFHFGRCQHGGYLLGYLGVGEWRIDCLHAVGLLGVRALLHFQAPTVGVVEHVGHATVAEQRHRRAERAEFRHARQVDAVAVGVAHLGRGADYDDLARAQAVEDAEYALAQRRAAHYRVGHASVGDVVDVCGQFVARRAFGYECAQLDVLYGYLFDPDPAAHDAVESVESQRSGLLCGEYGVGLQLGMKENTEWSMS